MATAIMEQKKRLCLPNFLVIGGSKSGTHWINECLRDHPEIYLTPLVHEIFFFDRYYERGVDWYAKYFSEAQAYMAVGDITPTYLANADAPRRVAETIPDAQLLVSLRNPVTRAWSKYLHAWRKGDIPPKTSLRLACELAPEIITDGLYFQCLDRWYKHFPREQIFLMVLEDAKLAPIEFLQNICKIVGVDDTFRGFAKAEQPSNTHATPRSLWISKYAFRTSRLLHRAGFHQLVQFAKWIGLRDVVLKSSPDRSRDPHQNESDLKWLRSCFLKDAQQLSTLVGRDLVSLWKLTQ